MSSIGKKLLRVANEKAQIVEFDRPNDEVEELFTPALPANLRHGDILYNPDGYRGSDTWVVSENGKVRSVIYASDDAGYAEIAKAIAARIEDPLDFYAGFTDENIYQGITTIVYSPKVHDKALRKITGGRSICPSRDVWWSSYSGWSMIVPPTLNFPRFGREVSLNKNTPDRYICDK